MNSRSPIRVLCIDDHPLIRDGIAFALQLQPDIELVADASNGKDGVALFREHRPDVTLVDLQMPDMDGIDTIAAIRREFTGARCIVLTTYSGDVQARRALEAGASGYLLKSMLRRELVDAIRAVKSGRRWIPAEIASQIAEYLTSDALSSRELEVLRTVAAGCSNKIVADRLGISEDTVKGHIKNILAKLGANDRTHAVLIALERGYLSAGSSTKPSRSGE